MRTTSRIVIAGAFLILAGGCASKQKTADAQGRQVRMGMADQLASRGDWAGAFRIADALVKEDPSDGEALLLRAKTLRKQEMTAEAESDLRKLLVLQPRTAEAHAELAILCEHGGRGAEALEHHQEASQLAPGQPRYLNNLAFALLVRGKAKDAIPKLEEALRAEPRSPRLRNNLGFAYAATGDFTRAFDQFRLGGTPVQAHNNLGFAYERAGNLAQAYELYLQAARLDPADATSRSNLSEVATRLGRSMPPEAAAPVRPVSEIGGS